MKRSTAIFKHQKSRLSSTMRGAVIRALRSIQAPRFVSAVVLFCLIYAVAFAIWSNTVGVGAWSPAWPVARTRFVLVMITTPIWAAFMASCAVVWRFIGPRSSSRSYQGYELAPVSHLEQLPTPGKIYSRPQISWWTVRLSMYLLTVAFGIFLLCFYEQPNDIRFRPLLTEAMRSPRPKGFGNEGMFMSPLQSDLINAKEKIFIAAIFHNNARIMPYWTEQITRLLHYIGTVRPLARYNM